MILGAALIFGALSLFIYNQKEAASEERATINLLPQLIEEIENQREIAAETMPTIPEDLGVPIDFLDPSAFEMTEVEIDGYSCIGYLSIPSLDLELPIMADWDDTRLKIAPCRYTGSKLCKVLWRIVRSDRR